jgi:hypothetical protein
VAIYRDHTLAMLCKEFAINSGLVVKAGQKGLAA